MRQKLTKKLFTLFLVCSIGMPIYAQNIIKGTVKDVTGEELPGVNVLIKDTGQGTITNLDGQFEIQAADGSVLVFSFIGFSTQKITVAGNSIDIVMSEDILGLDEVVITGTGALTEKRQLGSTLSTVTGLEISESGAVDISAALSGKLAGVQVSQNSGDPAGGISVRLRGNSTVKGSSDPLYIIDGVIVNNSSTDVLGVRSVVQNRLSDINPQDIDRIEVIRGAAAAAIYGSRATNGVVQIFTKRGKTGKPVVTVSSSVNFNSLRKKIEFNETPLNWTSSDLSVLTTEAVTRHDYQDDIFENSTGTDNYVSISGGKDNTTYFSSFSYLKNKGILKGTDFERIGARLRINQRINDKVKVSVGTYFSTSHSNDKPNGGYGAGVLATILFTNNMIDPSQDADGNYPQMTFYPNILEYIETFDFQQTNNRSISDFQLNFTPMEGLTINYILGYDHAESTGNRYIPIGTTTILLGAARTSSISTTLANSDLNATYDKELSSNVKSTTSVGFTWQFQDTETRTASAAGLALGVKTTEGASTIIVNEFRSNMTVWGGFIQQTFGFKDKLYLTGAARIDGSSVFGADERNQLYSKISSTYLISEEDFWKNSLESVFNTFKLRVAWGQSGSLTAIDPYQRFTNYGPVSINGSSGLISPTLLGNIDLRPERQSELEVGVDMVLFNNRIGVELTYYSQEITDLLLERTLSPSTGFGTRIENVGTMTNKGLELLVNAVIVQKKDFRWSVTGTLSTNKNEVNDVAGDRIGIGNFGFSVAKNKEALGVFYQGYYARNDDGSLLLTASGVPQREKGSFDENGNPVAERDGSGQPSGSNLSKVIGDPNPDFIASLINEIEYKNFSFRMQFDAVQGFDVLSWDTRMNYRFGGGVQEGRELSGQDIRGTGRAKFGIAEAYIEDGSYIKLREISASYMLRNPIDGINNLKFTLSGRNLFSIDNFSSYDPEVNMDAQSNGARGGVMGLVPIPRVIKLSVTATF